MSTRAKHSLPHYIKLSLNLDTGLYEATENGILYYLTFAQMNDLKVYCRLNHGRFVPTIESWYNSLTLFSRKNVKRVGHVIENNGFYPDE